MTQPKKILVIAIVLLQISIPTLHAAQVLFTPSLNLSEEYTDNVALDPDNEREDYITTAGLTLTGQVLGRKAGLELNYSPSYSVYAKNEDFDGWRHEAEFYTWKEIKRNSRLELRNTYLRTSDPADESEVIDPDDPTIGPTIESDTNRRGRYEYYANVAEARFTHQFGSDDSFYLAYRYSILRDVDIPVSVVEDDNDISTPSAGLVYNFSTRWGMEIDTSYASTDYKDESENDRDEINSEIRLLHNFNRRFSGFIAYSHTILDFNRDTVEDEDYQIYRPSIGIQINFQDNAGITIDGGYYIQDFETSDSEKGFNLNSEIFKRWEYRLAYLGITGASGYEIGDDASEDEGLTIYYEGGVSAGYNFTPRLVSSIHCTYRYEDFPNETPQRQDKILESGAGLDWRALEWMVIGLSYTHTNVASDDPSTEYTENSAMITIRMIPTSPYRLN